MTQKGVVHGRHIELDEPVQLASGTRVTVQIRPEGGERAGSPAAVLSLIGTLTAPEAEVVLGGANRCRRVDSELWNPQA